MTKIKAYYASPMFDAAAIQYHTNTVAELRNEMEELDLFFPTEATEINSGDANPHSTRIFEVDNEAIDASEIVIANLDGQTMDTGVASEIGIACAKNMPIFGWITDWRQGKYIDYEHENNRLETPNLYFNEFTIGCIKSVRNSRGYGGIYLSKEQMMEAVKEYVEAHQ